MNVFNKTRKIKTIWIVILVITIAVIFLTYFYYRIEDNSQKLLGLYSGLITGLFIAIIQLLLNFYEYEKIDKLRSMKIININDNRDSEDYYRGLIKESKETIDIMGVTMDRLFDDFADSDSPRDEKKVLIMAINRGVKVRFLLPKKEFLTDKNKPKFDLVYEKITKLNIEVRYFDHYPAHSIFKIDETCIVGPVFQELQSKDTPAIHFEKNSPFVKKYLDHFEYEWNSSE